MHSGLAVYDYCCNSNMGARCVTGRGRDLLFVPQSGALVVRTEFGVMRVEPLEICVVHRKRSVSLWIDREAQADVCSKRGSEQDGAQWPRRRALRPCVCCSLGADRVRERRENARQRFFQW